MVWPTCARCAADNMSAMVVVLKSFAPGDMVAAQRASAAVAGAGATAGLRAADGSASTPADADADSAQQAQPIGAVWMRGAMFYGLA